MSDQNSTIDKPRVKKPDWLRVKLPVGQDYARVRKLVDDNKLHTICAKPFLCMLRTLTLDMEHPVTHNSLGLTARMSRMNGIVGAIASDYAALTRPTTYELQPIPQAGLQQPSPSTRPHSAQNGHDHAPTRNQSTVRSARCRSD